MKYSKKLIDRVFKALKNTEQLNITQCNILTKTITSINTIIHITIMNEYDFLIDIGVNETLIYYDDDILMAELLTPKFKNIDHFIFDLAIAIVRSINHV